MNKEKINSKTKDSKSSIIGDTIIQKNKIKELEEMLDKLNYYISIAQDNDTNEKVEEYENYKIQLIEKINSLKNELAENSEEVKIYLSKLAYITQKLTNEIEMNKELKREADKRIKSLENSIDFIKSNIISTGQIIGLFNNYESAKLGSFNIRVNSTPTLKIKDKNRIPFEYQKEKTTLEIDTKKLKEILINGQYIEGAELVHNLVITGGKLKKDEPNE